ncbi:hypothetical protein PTKIN_Ptkin10aG0158300 [Pterospermum kingtungense]
MEFQNAHLTFCRCGIPVDLRTAWSNQNPRRRFLGCKSYGSPSACGFFRWYDPPMTERARIMIVGLLKKVRSLDSRRKKERLIWIVLLTCTFDFCNM